jgi:hypothetical protein
LLLVGAGAEISSFRAGFIGNLQNAERFARLERPVHTGCLSSLLSGKFREFIEKTGVNYE